MSKLQKTTNGKLTYRDYSPPHYTGNSNLFMSRNTLVSVKTN